MSSSSRSIAAARQRRAGDQQQPMNNSRPVTSIASQGAFAQQQQQQQQMMNQNIPINSKNVRVAQNRNINSSSKIGGSVNGNQSNQPKPQQEQTTKMSVSNAIGLITLRLGRLENIVNDVIEEGGLNTDNNNDNLDNSSIPSNMKLVSDEVFENIINRMNLLESKVIQFTNQNETFVKEIKNINSSILNLNSSFNSFVNETTEKFIDYENALAEMEKNFELDNNNIEYDEIYEVNDKLDNVNDEVNKIVEETEVTEIVEETETHEENEEN
jgi:hypothetical protein